MEIASFKKQKDKSLSFKSDLTTQITSKQHSRKSSFYLKLYKKHQQKKASDDQSLILPETKQKKKFMNVTVNKQNNGSLTDRTNKQQNILQKKKIININFCQEVPLKENYYTQNFKHYQNSGKQNMQKKQLVLGHGRRFSSNSDRMLYNLESPIYKLIQLQNVIEEIRDQKEVYIQPFQN